MGSKYSHLTKRERIEIETLLNSGHKVIEIADYIGVHRSTIYREIARGRYTHRNSDWTEEERYSCDMAQKKHDWNAEAKGKPLKIGNDISLAGYLEAKIADEKYSPEAAIAAAKSSGIAFKTMISIRTLYRYIDEGLFLRLTNKLLPIKGNKKKHKNKVKVQKRSSAGTSIEKRPEEVENRETFGHWEMDTVKGKRGKTKACILVLTERKTRREMVFKMKDQKADSVVVALDQLEKKLGNTFKSVFKSITVDNGVEFSDFEGLERSAVHEGERRTNVYYCHPYSSWERGSNENNNKLIRRHIPKGVDFDDKTDKDMEYIEQWMNNYPRGIFGFRTAEQLYEEEIQKLG